MGIFNLFGKQERESGDKEPRVPWKVLNNMDQLDEIDRISTSRPVAIFKHSTRCGISSMTLRQFEGSYDLQEDLMDLYFLDLLSYRQISDEVAIRYQVLHQSPQLIIIKNGIAVRHDSHYSVNQIDLQAFI